MDEFHSLLDNIKEEQTDDTDLQPEAAIVSVETSKECQNKEQPTTSEGPCMYTIA